eukprot:8909906-Karenia_brevis.AAC.1
MKEMRRQMDTYLKESQKEKEKRDKVPRSFKITKEDNDNHGQTPECPGCRAMKRGAAYQYHTQDCRTRFGNISGRRS